MIRSEEVFLFCLSVLVIFIFFAITTAHSVLQIIGSDNAICNGEIRKAYKILVLKSHCSLRRRCHHNIKLNLVGCRFYAVGSEW